MSKDTGKSGRHLYLLVNGKKSGDDALRAAIKSVREEGHKVSVRVTYEADCTERLVQEALISGDVDTIVAAGGDGSINQVTKALVKHKAPKDVALAVIPMGTANDFATGLGIPTDPWEAMQLAVHDTAMPIDVGTVNDEAFINVATGGFGTELTVKTDESLKNSIGGAAYAITGITNFSAITSKKAHIKGPVQQSVHKGGNSWQLRGPNKEQWPKDEAGQLLEPAKEGTMADIKGDLLILAVGNGRQAGGGVPLCPDAVLDDGLLDVSYVVDFPASEIPSLVSMLRPEVGLEALQSFGSMRVPWLEVSCSDGLQVNCDGEPMNEKKYRFGVLPKRLRVHMPKAQLLKGGPESRSKAQGTQSYEQRLASPKERPPRKERRPWQHPVVKLLATNGALLGLGVVLTIGVQRWQRHRHLRRDHIEA